VIFKQQCLIFSPENLSYQGAAEVNLSFTGSGFQWCVCNGIYNIEVVKSGEETKLPPKAYTDSNTLSAKVLWISVSEQIGFDVKLSMAPLNLAAYRDSINTRDDHYWVSEQFVTGDEGARLFFFSEPGVR